MVPIEFSCVDHVELNTACWGCWGSEGGEGEGAKVKVGSVNVLAGAAAASASILK